MEDKETNCRDWAIDEANEIREICQDLKYTQNRNLTRAGTERIEYLASKILEHLEYLDIKEDKGLVDEMTKYIATLDIEEDICSKVDKKNCDKTAFGECEECIKQYFEKKVEE